MRLVRLVAAAGLLAGLAAQPSLAQSPTSPTVGPAGGVPSTTAPSNSQGTPAGGTGTVTTTRVAPAPTAKTSKPHHTRRHTPRHAAPAPSAS